ncbi:outer membrane beta-barrel protein [Helicobacter cetorum]|uniref:Outer membrane protein n=1 Tax=Helicobacter cetorum (strain ATCC BAA-540 / CCUG 52418 / MIT 99-5656) TaxID=1163745 RepID=I0EQP0_HELCM|nr:outer membrane beta-barrel protein [Helicobacter cetorum]AFI05259.1 outer membrane protein [Helicobacter cetorum MIT 99-5656]
MGRIESKKRLKAVIFLASLGVLGVNAAEKTPFFKTKNHIYLGFRLGTGAGTHTTMTQQAYKDNPTCPNSVCYEEKLQAHYKGGKNLSYTGQIGDEISIDKYHILGLRVWGGVEYAKAQLGQKVGSNTLLEKQNYDPNTIKTYDPKSQQQGSLILQKTPSPQNFLFNNAHFMAFSLNMNVFVNLPIDTLLKHALKTKKMLFLKIGIFAGGGVEYAILWSPQWKNQNTQQNDKFFAAGGGFFVNFGGSLYVGKHNRLNVGLKIPYYSLNAQSWKNFGSSNAWQQQTIRQNFSVFRNKELFVSYAFLF